MCGDGLKTEHKDKSEKETALKYMAKKQQESNLGFVKGKEQWNPVGRQGDTKAREFGHSLTTTTNPKLDKR